MTLADALFLAASAAAVALMAGLAWTMGFRDRARLESPMQVLAAIAKADPLLTPEAMALDRRGRAALATFGDGRIAAVAVVGDETAVRLLRPGQDATVRLARRGDGLTVRVATADLGFPGVRLDLAEAPPWLEALAVSAQTVSAKTAH